MEVRNQLDIKRQKNNIILWISILLLSTFNWDTLPKAIKNTQEMFIMIFEKEKNIETVAKDFKEIQALIESIKNQLTTTKKINEKNSLYELRKKRIDSLSDITISKESTDLALSEYKNLLQAIQKDANNKDTNNKDTNNKDTQILLWKVLTNLIWLYGDLKKVTLDNIEMVEDLYTQALTIKKDQNKSQDVLFLNMSNVYLSVAEKLEDKEKISYYKEALSLLDAITDEKIKTDPMTLNNIAVAEGKLSIITNNNEDTLLFNIYDKTLGKIPLDSLLSPLIKIVKSKNISLTLAQLSDLDGVIKILETHVFFAEYGVKKTSIELSETVESLRWLYKNISSAFNLAKHNVEKVEAEKDKQSLLYISFLIILAVAWISIIWVMMYRYNKHKKFEKILSEKNNTLQKLAVQLAHMMEKIKQQEANHTNHWFWWIAKSLSWLLYCLTNNLMKKNAFIRQVSPLIRELEDYTTTLSYLQNIESRYNDIQKNTQKKIGLIKQDNREYTSIKKLLEETKNPCIFEINNTITTDISIGIPTEYINHAVYCLVDNAYKFLAKGETEDEKQTKKDKNITITTSITDDYLIIIIQDDGIGTTVAYENIGVSDGSRQYDSAMMATGLKGFSNSRWWVWLIFVKQLCVVWWWSLTIKSNGPWTWTIVTISFPAHTAT